MGPFSVLGGGGRDVRGWGPGQCGPQGTGPEGTAVMGRPPPPKGTGPRALGGGVECPPAPPPSHGAPTRTVAGPALPPGHRCDGTCLEGVPAADPAIVITPPRYPRPPTLARTPPKPPKI